MYFACLCQQRVSIEQCVSVSLEEILWWSVSTELCVLFQCHWRRCYGGVCQLNCVLSFSVTGGDAMVECVNWTVCCVSVSLEEMLWWSASTELCVVFQCHWRRCYGGVCQLNCVLSFSVTGGDAMVECVNWTVCCVSVVLEEMLWWSVSTELCVVFQCHWRRCYGGVCQPNCVLCFSGTGGDAMVECVNWTVCCVSVSLEEMLWWSVLTELCVVFQCHWRRCYGGVCQPNCVLCFSVTGGDAMVECVNWTVCCVSVSLEEMLWWSVLTELCVVFQCHWRRCYGGVCQLNCVLCFSVTGGDAMVECVNWTVCCVSVSLEEMLWWSASGQQLMWWINTKSLESSEKVRITIMYRVIPCQITQWV